MKIAKGNIYRIGIPKRSSSPDSPEYARNPISKMGQELISDEVRTWEEFFFKNPLGLDHKQTFIVHKIDANGEPSYVTEGTPKIKEGNGLGEIPDSLAPRSYENANSKIALEILKDSNKQLSRQVELLQDMIEKKNDEVVRLTGELKEKETELRNAKELFDVKMELTNQTHNSIVEVEKWKSQQSAATEKESGVGSVDKWLMLGTQLIGMWKSFSAPDNQPPVQPAATGTANNNETQSMEQFAELETNV